MIERRDEEFVVRIQQFEQEAVDRGARVLDALPEHAVADVDQHAETDGDPLVRELTNFLALPVLEDVERIARQTFDEVPLAVDHRRIDARDLDAGPKRPGIANRLVLWRRNIKRQGSHQACDQQPHVLIVHPHAGSSGVNLQPGQRGLWGAEPRRAAYVRWRDDATSTGRHAAPVAET